MSRFFLARPVEWARERGKKEEKIGGEGRGFSNKALNYSRKHNRN
jgi:hypothetical protein